MRLGTRLADNLKPFGRDDGLEVRTSYPARAQQMT